MRKNFAIAVTLLTSIYLSAQVCPSAQTCGTCTPDQSLVQNPTPTSLGIFPDSIAIFQGQYTDTVISFLMPLQLVTSGVTATINNIQVSSLNNCVSGFSWTCNQFQNNCNYSPQQNRWGCIRLCGSTFDAPGTKIVNVLLYGTGCASGICQTQPEVIPFKVTILSAGGNPFFNFSPTEGCDEVCVDFVANEITANAAVNPNEYSWDFGNGNTSSLKTPPTECYIGEGEYYPTLTTNTMEFVVTDVSGSVVGNWFCGDVEEPNYPIIGCTDAPDPFFVLASGSSSVSPPRRDDNRNVSWSGLDFVLEDQSFAIQFFDYDPVSNNDNGGLATISINQNNGNGGAGIYNYSTTAPGGGGVNGSITIIKRVKSTIVTTDTVSVYDSPAKPTILFANGRDTVCVADSVLLVASSSATYQWFQDSTALTEIDSFVYIKQNGSRPSSKVWVEISQAANYCKVISDTVEVYFQTFPSAPIIQADNGNLTVNNTQGYTVNWFDNGTIIQGENGNTLSSPSGVGPYTAEYVTSAGCATLSQPFALCVSGSTNVLSVDTINCCAEIPNGFTAVATGFTYGGLSTLAWGITPQNAGPIDSEIDAAIAQQQGLIFLGDNTGAFNFSTCVKELSEGWYYVTPFVIDNPTVEPLVYDTFNFCRPEAQLCPDIQGTGWVINPLLFTFPDGSSFNVNQEFLGGADITEGLWNTLTGQGPFCLSLTSLFAGNPNGTWTISVTNTSSSNITVTVPAFQVGVGADTCLALNGVDQIVIVPPVSAAVPAGQTKSVIIEIPPLPSDFPSINPSCNAYGSSVQFYYKACPTSILEKEVVSAFNVYPNPNNGKFVVEFDLNQTQSADLMVFNNIGQIVSVNKFGKLQGINRVEMDLTDFATGIYHVNLITVNGVVSRRLLIE
jgi:hypothetical protein